MESATRSPVAAVKHHGSKLFHDSVHGVMRFHRLIICFIDSKPVQRLRNIKQLSMGYYVYPAAAHNRFEHCLGVSFLAGKMLDTLWENSQEEWKEIFGSTDEEEKHKIQLALQIAGLLHDLGHGPFSHTWERFVKSVKTSGGWEHEDTSCILLEYMIWEGVDTNRRLTKLGLEFEKVFKNVEKYEAFIKALIKGEPLSHHAESKKQFLYHIVANKENDIDVDKFDYFLRDSKNLGMGIPFSYSRLFQLCKVIIENNQSYVAFRDVEQYSIQSMFQTRAELHIKAYQHRVVICLEAMLIDALKAADKELWKCYNFLKEHELSEIHEDPVVFLSLTDSVKELIENTQTVELQKARDILGRITSRKLYTFVGEWPLEVKQTEQQIKDNKPPKGVERQKLNDLEAKELGNQFAIAQICINKGAYFDPLKRVKWFNKEGNKANRQKGRHPEMKMDLPFYKLAVFQRTQGNLSLEEAKRIIEKFVQNFQN